MLAVLDNLLYTVKAKPILAALPVGVLILLVGAYAFASGGSDDGQPGGSVLASTATSRPSSPTVVATGSAVPSPSAVASGTVVASVLGTRCVARLAGCDRREIDRID